MSLKRHCETCDTTQHPRGVFGDWIHVDTIRDAGDATLGGSTESRLRGDYCSDECLLRRMLTIPGRCVVLEQTVSRHMEVGHDT